MPSTPSRPGCTARTRANRNADTPQNRVRAKREPGRQGDRTCLTGGGPSGLAGQKHRPRTATSAPSRRPGSSGARTDRKASRRRASDRTRRTKGGPSRPGQGDPKRTHTSHHASPAPTSGCAIASEGRFERSENLIAQRAVKARRSDAAIARSARRREGRQGPTAKGNATKQRGLPPLGGNGGSPHLPLRRGAGGRYALRPNFSGWFRGGVIRHRRPGSPGSWGCSSAGVRWAVPEAGTPRRRRP